MSLLSEYFTIVMNAKSDSLGEQLVAVRQPVSDGEFEEYIDVVKHYCACDYDYAPLKDFTVVFQEYVVYEMEIKKRGLRLSL